MDNESIVDYDRAVVNFLHEYRNEFNEAAHKKNQERRYINKAGFKLIYNCGPYEHKIVHWQSEMKDSDWPITAPYLYINPSPILIGSDCPPQLVPFIGPVPFTNRYRIGFEGISYKDEKISSIPRYGFEDPVSLAARLMLPPGSFIQPFVWNNDLGFSGKDKQLKYLLNYCRDNSISLTKGMDIKDIRRIFCCDKLGNSFKSEWAVWETPKGGLFVGPVGNTIITF